VVQFENMLHLSNPHGSIDNDLIYNEKPTMISAGKIVLPNNGSFFVLQMWKVDMYSSEGRWLLDREFFVVPRTRVPDSHTSPSVFGGTNGNYLETVIGVQKRGMGDGPEVFYQLRVENTVQYKPIEVTQMQPVERKRPEFVPA
jgi:hypothetical protein